MPNQSPLSLVGFPAPEGMTAREAMIAAGLDWDVAPAPLYSRSPLGRERTVPGKYAMIRRDTGDPLGVVGARYAPYQNRDFFEFVQNFCDAAGARIDRCGALRGGSVVWAAAGAGTVEYVPGDPVRRWFVARTSHDGTTNVDVIFSDDRIVCGNMIAAAFRGFPSAYRVRHTRSVDAAMGQIGRALEFHAARSAALEGAMRGLADKPLPDAAADRLTAGLAARSGAAESGPVHRRILELFRSGLGTDIPGVGGTAYGWLNAVTEYVDHYRPVKRGERTEAEARFDSSMLGSGARMKADAFELALAA